MVKKIFPLLVWLLAMAPGVLAAMPYRPLMPVRIISEYKEPVVGSVMRRWVVMPQVDQAEEESAVLRFLAVDTGTSLCQLRFSGAGSAAAIIFQAMADKLAETSTNGLLLIPGFPAPVDILPVSQSADGDTTIAQHRTRGGRLFVRQYTLHAETVSATEALEHGWLRAPVPNTMILRLFTVHAGGRDNFEVRQLWPVTGDWWLYEETPTRRSWRE